MRYFFHFVGDGKIHEDERGEHFSSVGAAKARAHVIAAELRADDPAYQSLVAVRVDDERGNEVARVPITDGKA